GGVEILLRGAMVASTRPGMPLEVEYTYKAEERMIMQIVELKPGAVDEQLFRITPDTLLK
ncbi:MAG: hypothetical protein ACO1NQ_12165, partial [Flavobacteriales bacterium]